MRIARNAVHMMMADYGRLGEEPSISVIIPAYNEGYGVRDAIESVQSQGYDNVEIIVVDDGSIDNTNEIASGYSGVTVLKTGNSGIAHARNYGAEHANGDILVWMDSDSAMKEGLLDRISESVRSGYVGGTARTLANTDGGSEALFYAAQNVIASASTAISNVLGKDISPVSDGGFSYCTREALVKTVARYGEAFLDLPIAEDREFVKRVADIGPISRITDTGIITDSRRIRKDGFALAATKRVMDYVTPLDKVKGREDIR